MENITAFDSHHRTIDDQTNRHYVRAWIRFFPRSPSFYSLNTGPPGPPAPPLPYDPCTEISIAIPTRLPRLAEVRVSLCINETLAWLLPVQFCIDQFLTAEEVVTKLVDAFWFLKAWSSVHAHEARELLRAQRSQAQDPAKSPHKYLIQ